MIKASILTVKDNITNRQEFRSLEEAIEKLVLDVATEIKENPGCIKWGSGSTIVVANPNTYEILSIRTLVTEEEYLKMVERGDIGYAR